MNHSTIHIEKVSNGWVIRADPSNPMYFAQILAVFNNIDDMTQWVKDNYDTDEEKKDGATC
jgi:hypothetical protein